MNSPAVTFHLPGSSADPGQGLLCQPNSKTNMAASGHDMTMMSCGPESYYPLEWPFEASTSSELRFRLEKEERDHGYSSRCPYRYLGDSCLVPVLQDGSLYFLCN